MFSNETIRKLREIHMGVMAEQLSAQLEDPQFRNVPFEDRLAMLVDAEWSARKSNRLTGLIKKASYADTQASVENIEYIAERHLDREQILRLASCSYIQEARNVIILGATGAGKTFLACSLGVAANRNFCAARYLRLPDLLVEIAVVRRDGTYREYMKQLKKVKLLILDEWLLYPLKEAEARDVLELVEARNKVRPPSSAPSMTPVSGMKICMIQLWRTRSATGSSTTRTRFRSRVSQCASAWV